VQSDRTVLLEVGHPQAEEARHELAVFAELEPLLLLSPDDLRRGHLGIEEGMPAGLDLAPLPKFRPGGLLLVHAGGTAGLFSAVIGGWVSGSAGSEPVTKEIA